MTDAEQVPPEPPPWLQFPRDMQVNGDGFQAAWFVNHTPGMVWLWLRWPTGVIAQPFKDEQAMGLAEILASQALAAAQLATNNAKLIGASTDLLGPTGRCFVIAKDEGEIPAAAMFAVAVIVVAIAVLLLGAAIAAAVWMIKAVL